MDRLKLNRICLIVSPTLSLMACIWILGNVAGGARSGGDEGLGFHIFWLLILIQAPFVLGYLATADWKRRGKTAMNIALQVAALVLAFSPVAYFKL